MSKKFYAISLVNYDENNIPVPAATVHCISYAEVDAEEAADFCKENGICFEAVSGIEEITKEEVMEYFDDESKIPNLTPCPFCADLKRVKGINDHFKKNSPRHANSRTEYKASLVTESYEDTVSWCTGTSTYQQRELNFCPTCGKKIEK